MVDQSSKQDTKVELLLTPLLMTNTFYVTLLIDMYSATFATNYSYGLPWTHVPGCTKAYRHGTLTLSRWHIHGLEQYIKLHAC